MKNNSRMFELFVTIITAVSVIMILDDYIYKLSGAQKVAIYIFDFIVVVIFPVDFYIRMRASNEGLRFILKHWNYSKTLILQSSNFCPTLQP
ncbi:MAG TPA: hypothetical protein VJ729_00805 [Nitrososphaeraceae archaeon]|nr:hypothetical protein [Nitrososphaeraceae archaeon]